MDDATKELIFERVDSDDLQIISSRSGRITVSVYQHNNRSAACFTLDKEEVQEARDFLDKWLREQS
jgi:K+/H+ antiporter YhaU regulatory subunit KhtT